LKIKIFSIEKYLIRKYILSNQIFLWLIGCNRSILTIWLLCINFFFQRHDFENNYLSKYVRKLLEGTKTLKRTRFVTNSHCCCKTNRTIKWSKMTTNIPIYTTREEEKNREKKSREKKRAEKSTRVISFSFSSPSNVVYMHDFSNVNAIRKKKRKPHYYYVSILRN